MAQDLASECASRRRQKSSPSMLAPFSARPMGIPVPQLAGGDAPVAGKHGLARGCSQPSAVGLAPVRQQRAPTVSDFAW